MVPLYPRRLLALLGPTGARNAERVSIRSVKREPIDDQTVVNGGRYLGNRAVGGAPSLSKVGNVDG